MTTLENLCPTFQKSIKFVNKQIREAKEPDASLVKALADLTRAYLQLQGKEADPEDGEPNYYENMVKEARSQSTPPKRKVPVKKKITMVKRKTS